MRTVASLASLTVALFALCLMQHKAPADTEVPPTQLQATITPGATGRQLVRASLPLPRGFLNAGQTLLASDSSGAIVAAVRPLSWHPAIGHQSRSVRRALVTFSYAFERTRPVGFKLRPAPDGPKPPRSFPVSVKVEGETVTVAYRGGPALRAHLLAPARGSGEQQRVETVESNAFFLWQRIHLPDPQWPRVIEVRADSLGGVAVVAHLQRNLAGDGRAPDFGWEITTQAASAALREGEPSTSVTSRPLSHSFADEAPCELAFEANGEYRLYHPAAPFKRRGRVEVQADDKGLAYRYWRCTADEQVPMQQAAWRRAEFVIAPAALAALTPTLQYPHQARVDRRWWDKLYHLGPRLDLAGQPALAAALRYHHDAITRSVAHGDDWGNLTTYSDGVATGGVFGMNRLNHCAEAFLEGIRSGDRRLLEASVLACDNFHDQSIWWGPKETGGTRYNNSIAMGDAAHKDDQSYMWRSNSAVNFCTKGFDAFLLAYEETGDPRMMEALRAQVGYASEYVHADQGECRNVGLVQDFATLYELTGDREYLEQALRLFRELRGKLSAGDLFSQGGQPILAEVPFIEDDDTGYRNPFAKPYIIGYALSGLPRLARYAPDEPKLREVVQAVADFIAASQDPIGGWRYPHPRSGGVIMGQALEHAWQLVQADRLLGVQERHLDAIERVLRQRILGWQWTGRIFSGLVGWEVATGRVKDHRELEQIYKHPDDRDFQRDYAEGRADFGSAPPEGLVYFGDVLAFYLQHRPAGRLLALPMGDDPLNLVLARTPARRTDGAEVKMPHASAEGLIVAAVNPDPARLPTLTVWEHEKLLLVGASFPNVPGFACDSWCYESEVDFVGAQPLDGGRVELRYRLRDHPQVLLVTTVTPEPGAVEFAARVELEKPGVGELPNDLLVPNMCWQLKRAAGFMSAPDPYPQFVNRCFIFTDKGLTTLGNTARYKIPCRADADPYNNPPWVQMYLRVGQPALRARPTDWADYSPDQYLVPVIGALSRDGKYLAALANDSARSMSQAWHDCVHNNAEWLPADAPPGQRVWRVKVYVMENKPDALLARVAKDFPGLTTH